MSASYVSTGAGGIDFEIDLAAGLLVRLITSTTDRILNSGILERVALQDRSGPDGFDDIGLVACGLSAAPRRHFIQAKRSFSFTAEAEFPRLARSILDYDDVERAEEWSVSIVAGQITPALADIQSLCASATITDSAPAFIAKWTVEGALNAPKRAFLAALDKSLEGKAADASWRVLRRLSVLEFDYDLYQSRDRQIVINELAQHLTSGSPTDAETLFGILRQTVLRDGKLAGSYSRQELLGTLDRRWNFVPRHNTRSDLEVLQHHTENALSSISLCLVGRGDLPTVSLSRAEIVAEGRQLLATEGIVRIIGEGGSGKSAILRRIAQRFDGNVLGLKDDRVSGASWDEFAASVGIKLSASELVTEFALQGSCLLAIDGADRLLLSQRRGVLTDLFRALANNSLRDRWSVITTARDFQTQDLVASALKDAGCRDLGRRLLVGPIEDTDVVFLGRAFPEIAKIARRGDLNDRNRILFLLREVLASPHLSAPYTEISLAAAWATRGQFEIPPAPQRDAAIAQMGELLVCRSHQRPGRQDLDPSGLQRLIEEGVIHSHATRDTLAFTHDVHEDWILARTFERHLKELPELLRAADEPLWWLRAIRLLGQILLESGNGAAEWLSLLAAVDASANLDPAWSRSILVAPLYSERANELLSELEPVLLANDAALLRRLLDTLLVFESRLNDSLLRSSVLAEMPEAERLRVVASLRIPQWRSWGAFLSWSVTRWQRWPATLVPRLSELAASWAFATEGTEFPLTSYLAKVCSNWLCEIEDAQWTDRWEDRRPPFGVEELRYHDWEEVEKRLRRCLKLAVASAPDVVSEYLARLSSHSRLDRARGDIVAEPRQVPAILPHTFVDVALAHFTPRHRRVRYKDTPLPIECFSSLSYQDAGISHDQSYFPSSPLRGGFASLFERDEAEALRLFHRLEMRASVFYRNFTKWHDRRRALPLRLQTSWGIVPLWGDENIYRWSRGILGSNVLGSAYLALDDWLTKAAASGRNLNDLVRLVLRPNGLIATAAPCISAIVSQINTPEQIDAAAPFLGSPRLWNYDLRRFIDDKSHPSPLGFQFRDDAYFQAAKRISDRYSNRQFLPNDLLLPFQLLAGKEAKEAFQQQRENWKAEDLAAYTDELGNSQLMAEYDERITRCRSDGNPEQIRIEADEQAHGFRVSIEPTAEAKEQIGKVEAEQYKTNRAMLLSNWVMKSRKQGDLDTALPAADAVKIANELEAMDTQNSDFLFCQLRAGAIIGTAALVARFANEDELTKNYSWVEERILAGCRIMRAPEDEVLLVDQAILFNDPQLYGAEGLAALINRGRGTPVLRGVAFELATHRLNGVASAIVGGLDWDADPEFAWRTLVAALDVAVMRRGRPWIKGDEARAIADRNASRLRAIRRATKMRPQLSDPCTPPPPYENRMFWFYSWRKPLHRARVEAKYFLDWSRAGEIIKVAPIKNIANDLEQRKLFERYMRAATAWTHAYSEDRVADRYQNHLPYEWAQSLARAMGRFAAATGEATLWEPLSLFDRHSGGEDLVADYLDAITTELINSARAPDELFWSAWRPPASWALGRVQPVRPSRFKYNELPRDVAAAGFVGPYMSPIPPGWPHVSSILPTVDHWARRTAHSASAAYALLRFAERLSNDQRASWLVPWLTNYVEIHGSNEEFWNYGSLGDQAAALVRPLKEGTTETRRVVRHVLAVAADAGSLAAREILQEFATARSKDGTA